MITQNIDIIVTQNNKPTSLDLGKDVPNFLQNISVLADDWDNIATTETIRTQIILPCTQKNNLIFGNYFDPAAQSGINTQLPVEVQIGGFPFFTGNLVIEGAQSGFTQSGGVIGGYYKAAIISIKRAWGQQLKPLLLSDLDFSAEHVEQTEANVLAGVDAVYPSQNAGFCCIKYDAQWKAKAGGATGVKYPDLYEFTGFVFLASIVKKIGEKLGVTFAGDFLNNANNFGSLIMPLPLLSKYEGKFATDYLNIKAEQLSGNTTAPNNYVSFATQTVQPTLGANPFLNPNYTVPHAGDYEFTLSGKVDVLSPVGLACAIWFVKNGNTSPLAILGGNDYQVNVLKPAGTTIGSVFPFTLNLVVSLQAGDTVAVWNTGALGFNGQPYDCILSVTGEVPTAYGTAGQLFYPTYLFGNWSARDFMLGIKQLFALNFETNDAGTVVTVEPDSDYILSNRANNIPPQNQQGFFLPAMGDVNIGDLIDIGAPIDISSRADAPAQRLYVYKPDPNDDYGRADSNKVAIPRYGAKAVFLDKLNTSEQKFENAFFASTVHLIDVDASFLPTSDTSTNPVQIPLMLPTPNSTDLFNFLPRILYFRRSLSSQNGDGFLRYTKNNTVATLFTMPHAPAFMVNMNDFTGWDMSLSFSDMTIAGNLVRGLLTQYHKRYLAQNANAKICTLRAYFSLDQIRRISLRNKALIAGTFYRVLNIQNYDPIKPDLSAEVTLQPETNDVPNYIENSKITPLVQ